MKKLLLILLAISFCFKGYLNAQSDKILVIVNSDIYSNLQTEIDRYVNDIATAYTVDIYETHGGTAEDLRNFIISQKNGLAGCVLIGNMPVFMFEINNDLAAGHPTTFPCDLYYMDLDGSWSDSDHNGIFDSHSGGTGDVAPEIFIGRIDAANNTYSGETSYQTLRKYLDKDHSYWTGGYYFRKTGLAYIDDDWKNYTPLNQEMLYLYGLDNYQLINDNRVSSDDYLKNRLPNKQYDFIQVAAHSNYHSQGFYLSGQIWTEDLMNVSSQSIGYNLFACSACDYTKNGFIGGAYIYNNSEKSLVVIGSTKDGAMLQFYAFYQPLGENKSIGEAYKEWFNYIAPFDDLERSWHYGMTLLGDPLVRFNSGSPNHGPLVNIGNMQRILWPDKTCELNGIVTDDGLPPGSILTHHWEKTEGSGSVFFEDSDSLATSGQFETLGEYRIKLISSDGEYTGEDFKKIKVSRIKWEGELPPNGMNDGIIVRDNIAYVTTTTMLFIANIENKANPYIISSVSYEKPTNRSYHYNLDIDSEYAYVASGSKGLQIINISDPYNPRQVSGYTSNDPFECINDVKISDNIAFIADSIKGLIILDIHDKNNILVLGSCTTTGTAEAVTIQGNFAYIAAGSGGLRIFDISEKANPREIGHLNISFVRYGDPKYRQDIQVIGNYAYISYQHPDKWLCTSIIDISEKNNPIELRSIDTYCFDFYIEGNYLYSMGTCDYDVFGIFDITDKKNPKLIESYKKEDIYFQDNGSIFESNHFLYLGGGQYNGRGLNIFKLSLENTKPYVYSGEDQLTCNNQLVLDGLVSDDHLPDGSSLTYSWEKINGPGDAIITNPSDINTSVMLTDTGTYVFRLNSSDGELTGSDDVTIRFGNGEPESGSEEACEGTQIPDLTAVGKNIRWYSDAQLTHLLHEGNAFATGETAVGIYTYYVTQSFNKCQSLPDTVTLTIKAVPVAPITQDATFCDGDPGIALEATGENVRWYAIQDSLTDTRDGNKYNTVRIGNQFWMADNLNTGTRINGNLSQSNNGTIQKYCYNDNEANCTQYGGLYQWNELMNYSLITENNQGICPAGWHIPSNAEWKEMEISLGMYPSAADSIGFRGSDQGTEMIVGGSSGFNAPMAGKRTPAGTFASLNEYTTYWNADAYDRTLSVLFTQVFAAPTDDKTNGFSLRCVSNDSATVALGNLFNPGVTDPGIYSYQVTQTISGCESPAASATLTIKSLPVAPPTNSTTVCEGEPVPGLTATGENIQWYSDPALTDLVGTGNSFTPVQTAPGTYTFYATQTVFACESQAAPVSLTIKALPEPPVTKGVNVCEGESIPDLTATGENIQWYSDAELTNRVGSGNTFAPGQTSPGVYTYYVTQTLSSCESEAAEAILTITTQPTAPVTYNVDACEGQPIPNLTATGENILWYSDPELTDSVGSGSSFATGQTLPGSYTFYVIQTVTDCVSDIASATLTIYPLPVIDLGEDTVIHPDESFLLGPYTEDYTYLWSDGSDDPWFEVSGETLGLGVHKILVIISDLNECTNSDSIMISVIPYTGIDNELNTPFRLFPNPTNGSITIDLGRTCSTVAIVLTSPDGRIIQREEIDNERIVDVQIHAQPGIYLVTITTKFERAVFRIVRN
jgi:uncharacterized protein (TIGR02145 family)